MIVRSRKTGIKQIISIKDWDNMEKNDTGSQRRYIIEDRSDARPLAEKIDVKALHPIRENVDIKTIEVNDQEEPDRAKMREYFDLNPTDGYYKSMTTPKMFELYKKSNQ